MYSSSASFLRNDFIISFASTHLREIVPGASSEYRIRVDTMSLYPGEARDANLHMFR